MQCPRCGSNWLPQYGHFRGNQTYRCGQCHYHFIPDTARPHLPEKVKTLAVEMYLEGLNISAIGRTLGIKLGTVYGWVKKAQWAGALWSLLAEQRAVRRLGGEPVRGHIPGWDVELRGGLGSGVGARALGLGPG